MSGIFASEAPKYWAAGLPAIPLMIKAKRPAINRWQLFSDGFPTEEERDVWLSVYPDGNIGLPMGKSSGLVAIDIDTDDPKILKVLNDVLPHSPWLRVGKKGNIRVFKYTNERTARIKAADGSMICEILSKGTQFVLPPSIHPDTNLPYTANANLYDVVDKVQLLPMNIETVIRDALKAAGIETMAGGAGSNKLTDFVPSGARDNAMVWHAGLLSRAILRGERTLIQALGEMETWLGTFVEQVIGDPITIEKARSKVVEFLVRDVTGERKMALPEGWDEGLSEEDKEKLGLKFTDEDMVWDADKIMEYLVAEFDRYPEFRDKGRLNAVNAMLDRIARSNMSALDESLILRFIAAQSANTMTQADLKRQLASLRRGDISGDNQEEIAAAVLKFLSKYGEVRFHIGHFWQWKGAHWEKKPDMEITKVIAEEFGNYPVCRRYGDYMGVLRTMASIANKPLAPYEVQGLNFANGFLNTNLELVDHDPDYGMTYVLPFRYVPENAGHMPMFNQYLMDSWGEDPDYGDKLLALQEAMGATLMQGTTKYQRAICLFGQGGSGKTQCMDVMKGLLPPSSTSSIPPQDWGDRFLPAQMFGKVMNYAGELSEHKNIPGDIFKQVVEGTAISGQHKNQPPFEFKPRCAQWFSSNWKPKSRDSSEGFNRRWLFLEWNRKVPDEKRIPELANIILESEREAIVAWAVQGWVRVQEQNGYTLPTSHMALQEAMAMDNNSVRWFLNTSQNLLVGKHRTDKQITAVKLHEAYWNYTLLAGSKHRENLQRFCLMMRELASSFKFEEFRREVKNGQFEIVYDGIEVTS